MRFTETAGAKISFTFRGTSITWQSGRGPDYGIASVQVDGGAPTDVDTYSRTQKYQEWCVRAAGLADAPHTLTVQATGRKTTRSHGIKIVVDAFDVTTPGRRHQGKRTRRLRIPANGLTTTSTGSGTKARATRATSRARGPFFTFTGTGVSWIGCQKESCSGVAKVFVDGAFVKEINNWRPFPIEAYQHDSFRVDGLTPGTHT
jgi:hypothetical protein